MSWFRKNKDKPHDWDGMTWIGEAHDQGSAPPAIPITLSNDPNAGLYQTVVKQTHKTLMAQGGPPPAKPSGRLSTSSPSQQQVPRGATVKQVKQMANSYSSNPPQAFNTAPNMSASAGGISGYSSIEEEQLPFPIVNPLSPEEMDLIATDVAKQVTTMLTDMMTEHQEIIAAISEQVDEVWEEIREMQA